MEKINKNSELPNSVESWWVKFNLNWTGFDQFVLYRFRPNFDDIYIFRDSKARHTTEWSFRRGVGIFC